MSSPLCSSSVVDKQDICGQSYSAKLTLALQSEEGKNKYLMLKTEKEGQETIYVFALTVVDQRTNCIHIS